jgi:HEAT repeat protein
MAERSGGKTSKARATRKPLRVQSLLALVLSVGAIFWAYRMVTEGMRPVNQSAKQLRTGDSEERQVAARQLANSSLDDFKVALPALVAAMGDKEPMVRAEVASGLGIAGLAAIRAKDRKAEAKETARVLIRALGDESPEVRSSAATALGEFASLPKELESPTDPTEVIPVLAGLLADPSNLVVPMARSALVRIAIKGSFAPPPALVEGVNAWPLKESRAAAAFALGVFPAEAGPTVAALTRALDDKEPEVRSDAASSLRKFGPDAAPAVPSLVKTLADPFVPPPPPEFAIVMTIPAGGGAAPEPTDPATQAARAIGRILRLKGQDGDKSLAGVIEALTKAASSDRKALSDAADEALGRIGGGASTR